MFEPIIVTAYLRCGIVCDPWLPLDGVLLYEAARRRYGRNAEASLPGISTGHALGLKMDSIDLPLLLFHDRQYAYYKCSFAQWGYPYAEGQDHWNKRNDDERYPDLLSGSVKHIEEGSGRYKSYHMPIFYRVAPWVRWWAVGNVDEVLTLLTGVSSIGKKRAYGWGDVVRWTVEPTDSDYSRWKNGVPQRAIPITDMGLQRFRAGRRMLWAYRPPYYETGNQCECFMPSDIRVCGTQGG